MATRAAVARRSGAGQAPAGQPGGVPVWAIWIGALLALLLVAGGGAAYVYTSLDQMYPQEITKYFRPATTLGTGTVLYRDGDGQLFLAPVGDGEHARRLAGGILPGGVHEIVRDAVVLPGGQRVAYFASETASGRPESDRLRVLTLDGAREQDLPVTEAAGEPVRPMIYASTSGRYLALTSRDRTRVYYYDAATPGALAPGSADAAPERMLWNRNADLRAAPLPGQPAFASSPDGKQRAQVRDGKRRAPECGDDPKCEAVQELIVGPATIAGSAQPARTIYGVFASFASDGWGPIPPQPAQRLYGRLVWSPDGKQVLFTTIDGDETRTYAISTDGKTQPRLVFESVEVLDWVS